MITKIIRIHGSSSEITFDCKDVRVEGSGEFISKDGIIAGFVVSMASLKYKGGEWLTSDEKDELIRRYKEYVKQPHIQNDWVLEFE